MVPMAFWTFWLKNTPLIIRLERSSVTRWLGWYMPRCRRAHRAAQAIIAPPWRGAFRTPKAIGEGTSRLCPAARSSPGKTPVYLAARLIAHLVGTKLTKEGHA